MTELATLNQMAKTVRTHQATLSDWSKLPDFPKFKDRIQNARGATVRRYDIAEVAAWIAERRAKVLPGRKPQPRGD